MGILLLGRNTIHSEARKGSKWLLFAIRSTSALAYVLLPSVRF
ncbi:hypothetical protein HanPSC8_Chr02g0076931 [Helianthus annuus]|nr:hypothetical protein HanPSC8_Chr02g0076931 [Helianthus annuus]